MKAIAMVKRADQYLSYRRNLGAKIHIEGKQLLKFAKFADDLGHKGPLTLDLALDWAQLPTRGAQLYKARRLEVVRCFAKYEAIFEPKTVIPGSSLLGPAHRRTTPYIFSKDEIQQILSSARMLWPKNGIRPQTYETLFSLLTCTGLRISEALRLSRRDFDQRRGLLTIRETKFQKSRLVPMHRSALEPMIKYSLMRDRLVKNQKAEEFFLSSNGKALKYSTVRTVFMHLRNQLPRYSEARRRPRMHDFRHTFACQRLLEWHRDGVEFENGILALSTYLGHVKVSDTYWYLTGIPELLEIASMRFEPMHTKKVGTI